LQQAAVIWTCCKPLPPVLPLVRHIQNGPQSPTMSNHHSDPAPEAPLSGRTFAVFLQDVLHVLLLPGQRPVGAGCPRGSAVVIRHQAEP